MGTPLDDLVKIDISLSGAVPTQASFDTILIAAQTVPGTFTNRVRLYSSLDEMTSAGFLVTDPAYLCAQKLQMQGAEKWKIGRRANKGTQIVKFTVLSAVEGELFTITRGSTELTYTAPATPTTSSVATAIAALFTGASTATAAGAVVTVTTAAAGTLLDYSAWSDNLAFQDATVDPGLAADLAAINTEDSDWYGLALDSASQREIEAAAPWVEANRKLFVPNTSDTANMDPGSSTDVLAKVALAAYARTGGPLVSKKRLLAYSGPAWMAWAFGNDPGSDTWKFATLRGVDADTFTSGERAAILAKKGNLYLVVSGLPMVEEGWSGSGEWLDVTRGIDWLRARLQFRGFYLFKNSKKIPFTDAGGDRVGLEVRGALQEGADVGLLDGASISVTIPKVASIPAPDRAARKFRKIKFSARLQGAIHSLEIDGSVEP